MKDQNMNDHIIDSTNKPELADEYPLDREKMPKHVAIVPDGNRRAARTMGLPDLMGHKKGADSVINLVRAAKKLGIKYVTLWGFSTENWGRSAQEVDYLMNLFVKKIEEIGKEFLAEGVRFRHLGRKEELPKKLIQKITELEAKTAHFTEQGVNVAINYGGKDEILRAIKKMIKDKVDPEKINEAMMDSYLDTAGLPEVDMVIRTGGEHRTSGYLPWQTTYAEFFFPKTFLPNFGLSDLKKILFDYQNRDRRFGKDSKKEDAQYKMVSKT